MKFRVSSPYGELAEVRDNVPHHGIDFAMPEGTALRSFSDGVVERVVNFGHNNLGKGVFIRNDDGTESIYGHMSEIDVKAGQHLHSGDVIGLSGNTGNSTGPHLHYGMQDAHGAWLDPTPIADKVANIQGTNPIVGIFNHLGDRIVGYEMNSILKPMGAGIMEALRNIGEGITELMPEIGAAVTVICAIGIMCSGNIPKWLGRWAIGMGGVIVWLINAD
jgi:murein DD-endopeptidase MepM/ murein hydrolase activator NlpD